MSKILFALGIALAIVLAFAWGGTYARLETENALAEPAAPDQETVSPAVRESEAHLRFVDDVVNGVGATPETENASAQAAPETETVSPATSGRDEHLRSVNETLYPDEATFSDYLCDGYGPCIALGGDSANAHTQEASDASSDDADMLAPDYYFR